MKTLYKMVQCDLGDELWAVSHNQWRLVAAHDDVDWDQVLAMSNVGVVNEVLKVGLEATVTYYVGEYAWTPSPTERW